MPGKGTGGGTSFEDMSHEQMLAWLDQANSGTVQGAADRLIAAAKEIRKIAEELKVRPQYVEWKGEGADAFRTWSGDLANSTLRLGDFSEGAAKWLGEASGAIATAQASIPRDTKSAQANLDAARAAHNDPDAAAVSSKSTSELAALAADKEKVRQEAAAQMQKLGQTYSLSSTQLDALERPKFPPPPKAIVPPPTKTSLDGQTSFARPGSTGRVSTPATAGSAVVAAHRVTVASEPPDAGRSAPSSHSAVVPEHRAQADVAPPTRMDIDSTATLPHTPAPHIPAGGVPGPGRVDGGVTPPSGLIPPALGGSTRVPAGPAAPGRPTVTGRMPVLPGQAAPTPTTGRAPSGSAIVGGRPTAPPPDRSTGAIPRGTVVGAEGTTTRGPLRPTPGTGPAGQTAGRPGQMPGRGVASPRAGAVGGSPPQPVRAGGRPLTPDGPAAPGKSGAVVRGGVSGGTPTAGRPDRAARSSNASRTTQSTSSTRADSKSGRSRRAAGDEETRKQGGRRSVPPVVD
ncbi:translation initiation factor IF-2 [Streptomyces sp. NPDC097610]|uniref:WXG100 family type VII secretion target n=1 Tax=Streptomyces sp. NPDC097610 TaxID=3157227 RepID=UPI00332D4994